MKENKIAQSMQVLGWLIFIVDMIVVIFIDTEEVFGFELDYYFIIGAVITLFFFHCVSEIIELLYQNNKKQDKIIELLKNISSNNNTSNDKNTNEKPMEENSSKELEHRGSISDKSQKEETVISLDGDSWICSSCGRKNLKSRSDCWSCGAKVVFQTHKWRCDCGNLRTATPCEHCGKK